MTLNCRLRSFKVIENGTIPFECLGTVSYSHSIVTNYGQFAIRFVEKLENYPNVKKFEDMLSRVDTIPACDRQTDERTDRHLATA